MHMRIRCLLLPLLVAAATATAGTPDEDVVRQADTHFWQAYNACDMATMGALVTPDVEFYHDKTGLTTSRTHLIESLRNGPCGDPHMRLRRAVVDGSLAYFPLAGGFAILSGQHRFYVQRDGKTETLDGQAAFTTVWKLQDGQWRMHRVLSYAHGPVPYAPPDTHLTLPPGALARFTGRYHGEKSGEIVVSVDGDGLLLVAGPLIVHLRAESPTRFFALERDLRFEFDVPDPGAPARGLTVFEHDAVAETAQRE